ncbi:MAG: hypothetical protein RID09_03665 [Coleofasciculus sp. G1-WW12-02]|uniref:hypothetical protein n=1 Tax=Coleofasciculus sp. G1-WW12-02 TaxID=3068483 RepID=UPI0032F6AD22
MPLTLHRVHQAAGWLAHSHRLRAYPGNPSEKKEPQRHKHTAYYLGFPPSSAGGACTQSSPVASVRSPKL